MATRDNLIATYQSNPTLQSRYTQQQYLDLFGFGTPATTTTTTPATTTTTTPAATTGIQNIIGQNLNQDRGGGVTQLQPTFTSRPTRPGVDFKSDPAAQLTGKGRLDPMGSGFYETLSTLEGRPSNYMMSTFNENFSPSGEVVKDASIDFNLKTNPNVKKAFFESVYQDPRDQSFLDRAKSGLENLRDKLFVPRVQGTLGTRLANQKMLPIPLPSMITAQMRNPLKPGAVNFNPALEGQLNYLEGQDGFIGRDPNSGGLKYGPESVLSGQNVISGFGSNDYVKQLDKYIEKMEKRGTEDDVFSITNLTPFQLAKYNQAKAEKQKFIDSAIYKTQQEEIRKQKEKAEREIRAREASTAARARAANPDVYARADALGLTDPKTGGFKSAGTNEAFSNKTGRGRTGYDDGGRVYLYNRLK